MSRATTWEAVGVDGTSALDASELSSGDVELWMIRCPTGFDAAQLDGLKVKASQLETLDCAVGSSGARLRSVPACEADGFVGLLPDKNRKRWQLSAPFARTLMVTSAAAAATTTTAAGLDVPRPLPPVPPVSGLRMRRARDGLPAAPQPSKRKRHEAGDGGGKPEGAEAPSATAEQEALRKQERAEEKAAKKAKKAAKAAKKEAKKAAKA